MPPKEKPKKQSGIVLALKIINGKTEIKMKTQHSNISDLSVAYSMLELMRKQLLEQIRKLSNFNTQEED